MKNNWPDLLKRSFKKWKEDKARRATAGNPAQKGSEPDGFPGGSGHPPTDHVPSQVFSHRLVSPILKYLQGRGLLLSIEAREALQQVIGLVIWLAIAVVAIFAGWMLLATALVGVLTSYFGWFWVKAAAITGGTHILIALTAGLVMWRRLTRAHWFADTLNELKKDRTWLQRRAMKN